MKKQNFEFHCIKEICNKPYSSPLISVDISLNIQALSLGKYCNCYQITLQPRLICNYKLKTRELIKFGKVTVRRLPLCSRQFNWSWNNVTRRGAGLMWSTASMRLKQHIITKAISGQFTRACCEVI